MSNSIEYLTANLLAFFLTSYSLFMDPALETLLTAGLSSGTFGMGMNASEGDFLLCIK